MSEYNNELLKAAIKNFIAEKRFLGYRYKNEEQRMFSFLKFVVENDTLEPLSKETILSWADAADGAKSRNLRLTVIRQFALYLNRSDPDAPAYIVPTTYRSIHRKDFCPYIYSKEELVLLFRAADAFGKVGQIPYSEKSFPLILRMLYGCGLRISEVLSLKVEDVNLQDGLLIIRDTKFFKDRLIPMHKNLTNRCLEYFERNLIIAAPNEYFFPSGKPNRIGNSTFYQYFRNLLQLTGIRTSRSGSGPRVHDIRHTFAVHCLKKLDTAGYDMNVVLPILATYMGHTTYEGTGTYLHLTAELYPHIVNVMEEKFEKIIPLGGCVNEY